MIKRTNTPDQLLTHCFGRVRQMYETTSFAIVIK